MMKAKLLTNIGPLEYNFPEMKTREDVRTYVNKKLKGDRLFQFTDGKLLEIYEDMEIFGLEVWEEIEENTTAGEDPFKPPAPGLDLKKEEKFFRREGKTTYLGHDIIIKFQGCVGQYKIYYLPVFIETDRNKVEVRQDLALSPDNLKSTLKDWATRNLKGETEEIVIPPGELGGWEEAKEYLKDYVETVEERIVPEENKNAKAVYGLRSKE